MSFNVRAILAPEIEQRILEISAIRINIFKDFPYIYDGSIEYEVKYLTRYVNSASARIFLVENQNGQVVGMSTCLKLEDEMGEIKKPFIQSGFDISKIFYFGESLLLSEYRGFGLGHRFFDEREKHALSYPEIQMTSFCAVQRSENHSLRPLNYKPLDEFWLKRGYQKQNNLFCELEWKDVDQPLETKKNLTFWTKLWRQQ